MSALHNLKMKMKSLQDAQYCYHQNVDHLKVRMANLKLIGYDMIRIPFLLK